MIRFSIIFVTFLFVFLNSAIAVGVGEGDYLSVSSGVRVKPKQQLGISFITPSIVRVFWTPDSTKREDNKTGVCVYSKPNVKWTKKFKKELLDGDDPEGDYKLHTQYVSSELIVDVNEHLVVTFYDKKTGECLLQEDNIYPRVKKETWPRYSHEMETVYEEHVTYDETTAHTEETANGQVTVRDVLSRDTIGKTMMMRTYFSYQEGEAIYGLGAHMEDYMNLYGKTLYLTQHNLKASVPFLVSTKGYGLLFDAGCAMKFVSCPGTSSQDNSSSSFWYMQQEACKGIDYYFVKGKTLDDVIGGYRHLTGNVSMMPRWLFGYTQSKERYVSSEDILNTLKEYRRRHVPIDMIVQDWNYWPQGWGYMKMNPKYYPDPKALADGVHAMNAKLMISIWPNPQWCPEAEDMKARGYMLPHDVYDVFSPAARKHYWKYANDEFFSRGFDAWWCDSSEPLDGDWNKTPEPLDGKPYGWDDQARRYDLNRTVLSEALGAERSNLYSLYHSMGIYENQRQTTSNKRVVNLTRSTYAGQQRYGTVVWNGDTHASWQSFKQQIPSGLNYMASGNPYWTVDVGSFFTRNDGRRWFYKGEFQEGVNSDSYKEYYTRMFQWATFLPMLRSHGSDTPREIWRFGEPGTKYYDAILKMINLRYEHIPYIYSMAARQSSGGYTMARLLAFDFPKDTRVHDIKDQYMFGSYLVCPVTDPDYTQRSVYLPRAKWYDYWTGKVYEGGQSVMGDAPIDRLPLYVRAGAIIPTTEVTEYSDAQKGKDITIKIYPGADGQFELYEDEGDNYNFERGECSRIPFAWNDKTQTLTIGNRSGEYKGMQANRTFIVSVLNGQTMNVEYNGKKAVYVLK